MTANRARVDEALSFIRNLLEKPTSAEEILAGVCERFGIAIAGMGQYYLMNHTVMAYLSYLLERNEITASYIENRQVFART